MLSLSRVGGRSWLCALIVLFFALGCGPTQSHDQKPVHPVRGKLFIADKPAAGAFVLFVPDNEPANNPDPRPRATVNANGEFQLSTYGENDGAPAGTYSVAVTWPENGPDGGEDRLKGRYRDPGQTKLKVTVKDGPNELPPFNLK
jgi:hypothetical protein